MTSERWQQVKTIYDGAVECDPSARASFVSQHCGEDRELRTLVESLLASERETGVLGNPVTGPVGAASNDPPRNIVLSAAFDQFTPILNDRYEIVRELGRGGMSVVYLARDRQLLAKPVVVKVLRESTKVDPWIRQKFLQEMEALSRIDHPGVVGVLDTGVIDGQQFLVMQYIEGATLRGAIQAGGMDFARAAVLIRQIGQALAAAHEKGVWHRDLKPENIMLQQLGGEEHVKLIDFGIAGIQNSQFSGVNTKVAGSLTYMAPEQFVGHPSAASDTYALGVVAYEILTGNKTFSPDSMTHLVTETQAQPVPPRELRPELPEAAERSLLKALSFHVEHRHATVREFSEELCHALTGTEPARKPAASGTIEIAHVLFTGLVDYSLLAAGQQKEYVTELQRMVRESPQFRASESACDLVTVPAADGIGLIFFGDPTSPAQCAMEVAAKLKNSPHLKWRMGIHSGPAYRDANRNANLTGGGINMGRRVMEFGDAGHILVSKSAAELLLQCSPWPPYLAVLGEGTTKDGVKLQLSNLVTPESGNRERPRKLRGRAGKPGSKTPIVIALALVVLAATIFWLRHSGANASVTRDKPSIAVLPFVNMTSDKEQDYFSEGLAEELLNALAKIPGLRVAGRMSSFQFKGKIKDPRLIGETLRVATILEGSVRRQGNRTRITTQLIQTADGFDLWSEIFDRQVDDAFAVQEEIARAVTGALKIHLMGEKTKVQKKPNAEAYNAYLKGRYFLGRRNKEELESAVRYFEQATKLDPGYAQAWTGLALSNTNLALWGYVPVEAGYRKAREAVARALALDADLGEAHRAKGAIEQFHDRDWAGAETSYHRALELEPGNADAVGGAASLARGMGRFDEAIALYRRAIDIDPLNSNSYYDLGLVLHFVGRQPEAKTALEKALELAPDMATIHGLLGRVYLAQSNPRQALSEAEKEKDQMIGLWLRVLVYHALGQKKESGANLAELIAKYQTDSQYQIAEAYAFRGETDQAFAWLNRAYTEGDSGLAEIKGDPLLKSLEHDPRYAELLKKLRLPL